MAAVKKPWDVDVKYKFKIVGYENLCIFSMQLLFSETDFSEHTLVFQMMADTITHFC